MAVIVKSPGVTEQVVDYLKEQITQGRWTPGSKIDSENQLTKELGVSRASVRGGIWQLVAIGVLETHQGKGTFVRSIPAGNISRCLGQLYQENKDMHDLMEYRMILETESCRLAAARITPQELEKIEQLFVTMKEEHEKKQDRSSEVFADSDFGFHRKIYIATGNQLVVDSARRIGDVAEQFQRRFNTDYLTERAVYYHGRILQALKDRDGEKAAREMRRHLQIVISEYDRLIALGEDSENAGTKTK